MKQGLSLLLYLGCCTINRGIFLNPATAQVTPDGTTKTTVDANDTNGNNFTIQQGDLEEMILLANVLQGILHEVLLITEVKIFRHCITNNFSKDYFRQQYQRSASRRALEVIYFAVLEIFLYPMAVRHFLITTQI